MVVLMRRVLAFASILVVATMGLAAGPGAQQGPVPPEQVVEVTAERFAFQPSEIRATAGTTLKIVLKSDDTTHGFRIKGEGVNVAIPKRGRGTVTASFTPSKPGRYTFECSRVCGAGHSFMRGTIVVSESGADAK
jgi:cytochrome c oxidase subunit 2